MKTVVKNFLRHQGTDLAAGLTYYAVLAVFPAVIALMSLLALTGDEQGALDTVLDVLRPLISDSTLNDIQPTLEDLTRFDGAPLTFALGAAGALWSASGYVGAFGRAMNVVREVEETRPWWKLRPLMLLVTLVSVVLIAVALVIVVATGPLARSLGDELGVGSDAVDLWEIAKWPALAIVVVIVVSLLFHATPNVRFGFRLLTVGSFLALLLWAAASTGFAFYVANFGSYDKTYGSIAGVIVSLLWLWLTNVVLLFGAEVDAARAVRKQAAAAMVAASGPVEEVPDGAVSVSLADLVAAQNPGQGKPLLPPWASPEKILVRESFPRRPGEAPYGPRTQPVPEED